jgi:Xaa-Pro aminopeptidase
MFVNSGDVPDLLPSPTKKLMRGETLWLDGGVYVGGYTCDFSRVASLGPPSARQKQLHRDVVEVFDLVFAQIRPGVAAADLARLATGELERRGYMGPDNVGGAVAGHSMGMLINEPPMLAPWSDLILSEGLVAGIEFGPSQAEGFFVLEHLIQVTSDGFDLLTPETTDMVEIDF